MKKRFESHKRWLVCGIACAALLPAWAAWRERASAASGGSAAAELIRSLRQPGGDTAADREIGRWTEQARRHPQDSEAWANLGNALMQKARDTADVACYARAERIYRQALALDPRSAAGVTGIAWVLGCRHEFEQSIEWANRAIALDRRNQAAYGLLGDAAVELGDYDAAFRHYQRMIDVRPDLASYSRGAHLLYLVGNTRKATWLMRKAIEAGSPYAENTAWCRAQLAQMLWANGALPAAEKVLAAALEKTPENAPLLAAMGRVKVSRKDYPAAIGFYRKAIALAPQHDSLAALGDLYSLTGNRAEAEKQYATVEAIHALNKANGVRGDMQIALFDANHNRNLRRALDEARAEYRTRKNVFAADTLAWCCYQNGRCAEAREIIRQGLSRGTPEASFYFHAGMIHARLGDRGRAQRYLYQALSLNPNFSPIDAPVAAETLRQLGSTRPSNERAAVK
jgi:tetratricopeptide (TPR) repeat protein